jgi:hypothetical protein
MNEMNVVGFVCYIDDFIEYMYLLNATATTWRTVDKH